MSIATLLGFLASIASIVIVILEITSDFAAFFHLSGLLLVFGGTLASAFMGYEFRYVMQALAGVGGVFIKGKADRRMLTVETGKIIRWGYLVKKSGLVSLEKEIKGAKSQDHFLNYGIELVITGYSGEEVRSMLGAASKSAFARATIPVEILKAMAGNGPAFGMVGTPAWHHVRVQERRHVRHRIGHRPDHGRAAVGSRRPKPAVPGNPELSYRHRGPHLRRPHQHGAVPIELGVIDRARQRRGAIHHQPRRQGRPHHRHRFCRDTAQGSQPRSGGNPIPENRTENRRVVVRIQR